MLPPIQKIEVSEKHIRLRVVLTIVFLVIAVTSLIIAAVRFFSTGSGWRGVTVNSTDQKNTAGEIFFHYEIGQNGPAAGAEYRAISALYTEASVKAYRLFQETEEFAGITNLASVNHRPNEEVRVEPELYRALRTVSDSGSRLLFLAPVYDYYRNLFFCTDDSEIAAFDPTLNEEVREEFAQITAFTKDPEAVSLELLDGNRVILHVSEAYLAYAGEHGIDTYLDFFWLKNAFIVDYLADVMIENGYTNGTFSSFDGFLRNLDPRGTSYRFALYDCPDGDRVYTAGDWVYQRAVSIVYLRNYPMNPLDSVHYYTLRDGSVRSPYIGADGNIQTALPQLVGVSESAGCAEIALRLAELYIAPALDTDALTALRASDGIAALWIRDRILAYTDPILKPNRLLENDTVRYTAREVAGKTTAP